MKSSKMLFAAAAMAGLLTGSAVRATASTVPNNSDRSIQKMSADSSKVGLRLTAGTKVVRLDGGTHSCKGANDCKGQGGCKTGDNGCKGQNSCKGKGGCKTDGSTTQPGLL